MKSSLKLCLLILFSVLVFSFQEARAQEFSSDLSESVPVLLKQLKDKDKQYYAIQSLVKLDAKEAAPEIAKLLKSEEFNVRHTALMALVSLNAREQVLEIWNLVSDEQLKSLATAALIYLADERAIRWFSQQIAVDREFSESVLGHAGTLKAKPIIPALIAILEKGKLSDDRYFDLNLRRSIINCLGYLEAKEAAPVLRKYVRGEISFRKWEAIRVLGDLESKEAIDDLIFVLSRALNGYTDKGYGNYGDDYHTIRNAGLALAKIGDKKAWKVLIEAAAHPKFYEGSEVVSGLNQQLAPELWERAKTQKVSAGEYKSIKYVTELVSRETGISVVLELERENFRLNYPESQVYENTDGFPWITTGEETTVFNIVDRMPSIIKDQTTAEKYTYIFDNAKIRILPLKKAVEWWRNNILTK